MTAARLYPPEQYSPGCYPSQRYSSQFHPFKLYPSELYSSEQWEKFLALQADIERLLQEMGQSNHNV